MTEGRQARAGLRGALQTRGVSERTLFSAEKRTPPESFEQGATRSIRVTARRRQPPSQPGEEGAGEAVTWLNLEEGPAAAPPPPAPRSVPASCSWPESCQLSPGAH